MLLSSCCKRQTFTPDYTVPVSCNNGRKYIAVVCGDIEVLRVKGLVCRGNRLNQEVKMFREGPLGYLALATSPRTVVSWRQQYSDPS
jgi:hypothetical protein